MDSTLKLQPLHDYVIMQFPADEKRMIVRPSDGDATKIGTFELEVVLTGPDCRNIKIGDRLIFNIQACVSFSYDEKQHFLVGERSSGLVLGKPRRMKRAPANRLPV